jgi:hypothetical protein
MVLIWYKNTKFFYKFSQTFNNSALTKPLI